MAVSLYIVLSGFVTHLAYHSKSFTTWSSTYNFYLRRFGRIWLTYYFSCFLGLSHQTLFHELLPWRDYVMPLLLLDSWDPTARLDAIHPNPNPAGWTLSTLTLAWAAYPAFNAAFRRVPTRPAPLVGLMALLSVVAVAPALVLYLVRASRGAAPGEMITRYESLYLYQFPPLRLCEFLLGMASSQLLRVDGLMAWPHWQWVGWSCVTLIFLASAFVPSEYLGRVDQEAVFISVCSPAWALVLIAVSAPAEASSLVRALRHPVISSIGAYSFAVYLFQWAWYYAWYETESLNIVGIAPGIVAAYLPCYLVTLWLSAALWTELVEAPFAVALKELLTTEAKPPRPDGEAKGATAAPPATPPVAPPVAPRGSRLLFRTSLRVGVALLVGVGVQLLMLWVPMPTNALAPNATNGTAAFEAKPLQSVTTVSSRTVKRTAAAERNATHATHAARHPRLRTSLLRTLQPRSEQRRAAAEVSENTCEWSSKKSPEAMARGRGEFVAASKDSAFFSLQGRWVDEEAGGVLSDWSPGATVGFQVNGTDSVFVAAHRRCATRGLSGRGAVFCCDWASFIETFSHGEKAPSDSIACGAPGLLVDVLVDGAFAGTFDGSPRCSLEQFTNTPEHHALHQISGLDPSATSTIHLVVRTDAKRGGLTVRGLVLPDGGRLLPLPDLPAPRGRMVILGGSKSLGQGLLADADPECSGAKYSAVEHPAYAWPSVLAHELRLEYSGVGFGSFHCSRMAAGGNGVIGSSFDPDFPMMNASTAPRTHEWYRRSLANTAIDNSKVDFAALEAEAPTLLVLIDLEYLAVPFSDDPGKECEESLASLVVVLHELHPRALLVMDKDSAKVAVAANCPRRKSLCDAIVALDTMQDTEGALSRLDEADREGCNRHPNGLSHSRAAHYILQQLRNHPRFLREPLLAAANFSAAASPFARDRSPVLSGDLQLARWRYLPSGPNPIPAFGTPLTVDAEGYCDAADLLPPVPSTPSASQW